jgi:hypothetical protein
MRLPRVHKCRETGVPDGDLRIEEGSIGLKAIRDE